MLKKIVKNMEMGFLAFLNSGGRGLLETEKFFSQGIIWLPGEDDPFTFDVEIFRESTVELGEVWSSNGKSATTR
jgi:hypothetical protein